MAITSSFANLATVTRASKKTDTGGWDFVNGSIVGSLTEYATNVAAIHGSQGILIEPTASTNEIRNPRFEGAVVGTPGTLPTNFTLSGANNGISYAVAGLGEEDGADYMDLRIYGTTTGNVFARLLLESSSQISASAGEAWTFSAGLKLISGALENFQAALYISETNGASNVLVRDITDDVDSNHRRFFGTTASTAAGTTAVQPGIWFNCTVVSTTVDFVIRIYAPQCENLDYPTSFIRPEAASPAATTRAADAISVPNGSWENDGAGSVFGSIVPLGDLSGAIFYQGADNDNRVGVIFSSGELSVFANYSGATQWSASVSDASPAIGTSISFALGYDTDDGALSVTGGTQITDSSLTLPALASGVVFGKAPAGGAVSTGFYLRDFRYLPRRLTNAELEALVGN